jgi:hypothetical protein
LLLFLSTKEKKRKAFLCYPLAAFAMPILGVWGGVLVLAAFGVIGGYPLLVLVVVIRDTQPPFWTQMGMYFRDRRSFVRQGCDVAW